MMNFEEMDDKQLMDYIRENWEEAGAPCSPKGFSKEQAEDHYGFDETYLSEIYGDNISQEQIDQEVAENDLMYFTGFGPEYKYRNADHDELITQCKRMEEILEEKEGERV